MPVSGGKKAVLDVVVDEPVVPVELPVEDPVLPVVEPVEDPVVPVVEPVEDPVDVVVEAEFPFVVLSPFSGGVSTFVQAETARRSIKKTLRIVQLFLITSHERLFYPPQYKVIKF